MNWMAEDLSDVARAEVLRYVDQGLSFEGRAKGSKAWQPVTAQGVIDAITSGKGWEFATVASAGLDPLHRPSVIVYGEAGCGKTWNAEVLRLWFKLAFVRDLDPVVGVLPSVGTLFLTNMTPAQLLAERIVDKRFARCWAFESVMRQIEGR